MKAKRVQTMPSQDSRNRDFARMKSDFTILGKRLHVLWKGVYTNQGLLNLLKDCILLK